MPLRRPDLSQFRQAVSDVTRGPVVDNARSAMVGVLAAAVLFGTTGTVLVNAPDGTDAYSVGCIRLALGGLTLLALALAEHRRGDVGRLPGPYSCVLGAMGVAVFQLCYFLAVERTGVAVGTVVTIGSGPVLSGVINAALQRRPPPQAWMLGTGVGVTGVALLGLLGRGDISTDLAGIGLAVLAGLGWATFATVGKRQIDSGVRSTVSMAAMFCGGAVLLSPLLVSHSPAWFGTGRGLLTGFYLGVVTVGLAYWLYGIALRHLAAPTVITLTLLEPITAASLGAVVVHEHIRPIGWVGVGLVLAGLVVTAMGASDPPEATTTVAA